MIYETEPSVLAKDSEVGRGSATSETAQRGRPKKVEKKYFVKTDFSGFHI